MSCASFDTADAAAADLRTLLSGVTGQVALYFAVPPAIAARACTAMTSGMLPAGVMLALEKPFGTDEASARGLNARLAELVSERQVFRVDHFLGKWLFGHSVGVMG